MSQPTAAPTEFEFEEGLFDRDDDYDYNRFDETDVVDPNMSLEDLMQKVVDSNTAPEVAIGDDDTPDLFTGDDDDDSVVGTSVVMNPDDDDYYFDETDVVVEKEEEEDDDDDYYVDNGGPGANFPDDYDYSDAVVEKEDVDDDYYFDEKSVVAEKEEEDDEDDNNDETIVVAEKEEEDDEDDNNDETIVVAEKEDDEDDYYEDDDGFPPRVAPTPVPVPTVPVPTERPSRAPYTLPPLGTKSPDYTHDPWDDDDGLYVDVVTAPEVPEVVGIIPEENSNNQDVFSGDDQDVVVLTEDEFKFDEIKSSVIGGSVTFVVVFVVVYVFMKCCKSRKGRSAAASGKTDAWKTYDSNNLHNDSPSQQTKGGDGIFTDPILTPSSASLSRSSLKMMQPPMGAFRDEVSSIGGGSYKDDIISIGGGDNSNLKQRTSLVNEYGETRDAVMKATYV